MELRDRIVTLYGRFTPGVRKRLTRQIAARGARTARDLTLRSDVFVIGANASALIGHGALGGRIAQARHRQIPVLAERRFLALLDGRDEAEDCVYPLASALAQTELSAMDVEILAAFDLARLAEDKCRFADVATLRTANELCKGGASLGAVVRILAYARDAAPSGRRKIVLTPAGVPALQWDDGLTTLEGQGFLPLDTQSADVDELFEAALVAEAEEQWTAAARLYDMCARADRRDPIAPYNYANIKRQQGALKEAALAYRRAIARDPHFSEARYNLAQVLEALTQEAAAAVELANLLALDPAHADALFNLAQLRMKESALEEAEALYTRYLQREPPEDWADKARRAIAYCRAARRS